MFRLSILLALVCSCTGFAADEVIHGQDQFHFEYRVTLPELEQAAKLWMPIARTGPDQQVTIDRVEAPTGWKKLKDAVEENDVFYLELPPAPAGQSIAIHYTVTRREKESYAAPEPPARDLEATRLIPRNEVFQAIAARAVQGKTGDLARGRALYDHVLERMKYAKTGTGWGKGDAVYACDARTGNCSDFHSYFMALARVAGLPARFAIGFTIPAGPREGAIPGYHCWAEFYAGGRWVPIDLSEAKKNPALADYYFGHHPANRFELNTGRDLRIDPAPSGAPLDFLIYPVLEVAGVPRTATTQFTFEREAP